MLVIPHKLKSFNGVGWGQKAVVQIQGGPTIHEIVLTTNLAEADIQKVTLVLNGDPIYALTGAEMKMLERYRKRYEEAGKFVLYFADIVNETLDSIAFTALVTHPTDNITLEIDIGAGAGAISLSGRQWLSASQPVRQFIPRTYKTSIVASQTKENVWDSLERGPQIRRIHFNGDLEQLEVKKDRLSIFDLDSSDNEHALQRHDRAPQAGYFHFDPIMSGFGIANLFNTADVSESLEFFYDVPAAATVPVIIESVKRVTNGQGNAKAA